MQNAITALAPLLSIAIYVILKSGVSAWRARARRRVYQQRSKNTLRLCIDWLLRRVR
ncbi:hypothetical protein [Cupriavidus basilensis]|uniref:hypothetical protein n=1 Tax=Cupriavidus basilensis TaxID=68895 RepID=UPI0039F692A8